jgi:hypothetical protein
VKEGTDESVDNKTFINCKVFADGMLVKLKVRQNFSQLKMLGFMAIMSLVKGDGQENTLKADLTLDDLQVL